MKSPQKLTLVLAACAAMSGRPAALAASLEATLKNASPAVLAGEIRLRGDAKRGALVFHTSAAGCVQCHASGEPVVARRLGPDLATLGNGVTDEYLINALLHPSRDLREGYKLAAITTTDGEAVSGFVLADGEKEIVLRDVANLEKEIAIPKSRVAQRTTSPVSMMPEGLIGTLRDQREFYDLVRYVMEVARGGAERAAELQPAAAELAAADDSGNLDHAGILQRLGGVDYKAGGRIYNDSCVSCHGADGNTPALPTARAFGTQPMKFGADPYRMFMTLTQGNGLMAPMRTLTPKERYQVVHYIRERFMRRRNPDFRPVDAAYLTTLPKGTNPGILVPLPQRDYGPVLASGLGAKVGAALTIALGDATICYDLHRMDQVAVWRGGFLKLDRTLLMRMGGLPGLPLPGGAPLAMFAGWQWGHDGSLDYPRTGLSPRGPLPEKWLRYRGRYVHGDRTVLSYQIDGREILELPAMLEAAPEKVPLTALRHHLRIGPGAALVLAVAAPPKDSVTYAEVKSLADETLLGKTGTASGTIAFAGAIAEKRLQAFTAATVSGDTDAMQWVCDDTHRLVLHIPADNNTRVITVTRFAGEGAAAIAPLRTLAKEKSPVIDPAQFTKGGPRRQPQALTSVGLPGLETGAYVLDTITPPDSTPRNTWFQTSALDFFADGRMALATHGGDVWIVSGLDHDLLNVKWSHFASGLYEPMGLKVVDDIVYVTGKDGITRLHDLNGDGEADFHECFSADDDVSARYHAFNFDLQRDPQGHFYYSKSGQYTYFAKPGAVIQVSPDGRQRETFATGFRTPNGLGMLPDGRVTAGDNQGFWIPASKISIVQPGRYYGYVSDESPARKPAKLPDDFAPPMLWMPQELDNSSGGQAWAEDPRWGPLSGHLLHTSYGKGWLYYLMMQEVGDVTQAAIVKLPHQFTSGVMRARMNPADGQLYTVGLQGWNPNGRPGLREHGVQRLRYTGKPFHMVTDCQVVPGGLRVHFNFALDPATTPAAWQIEHWNYHWGPQYGSLAYSPITSKPGKDKLAIASVTLAEDNRTALLRIPELRPVHQLHLQLSVKTRDGEPFTEELHWTIHRVPAQD